LSLVVSRQNHVQQRHACERPFGASQPNFPECLASSGGSSPPSRPYRHLHPGVADFEARQLFGIGIGLVTAPQ